MAKTNSAQSVQTQNSPKRIPLLAKNLSIFLVHTMLVIAILFGVVTL